MNNHPKITFIICTFNRADYLNDTIRSLLDHDLARLSVTVLVVDNNSTDETVEVVKQHQQSSPKNGDHIRYVKEPKQGLSHARNRGIKEAQAPCIVFLDDDIQANEWLIPSWLSFFEKHPDALAAGGKILVQFDDPRPGWMSHFLLPLLGHHDLGENLKKYPTAKYPFGGNMGFRTSLFQRLEAFNPDLGRKGTYLKASEEKELFQRLKDEQIDIYYVPQALLYHRVNKKRLTKKYIKKQAVGLGQSIALLVQEKPHLKIRKVLQELLKLGVSLILFLPYLLSLQVSKALMLLRFRFWIAEGYFNTTGPEVSGAQNHPSDP